MTTLSPVRVPVTKPAIRTVADIVYRDPHGTLRTVLFWECRCEDTEPFWPIRPATFARCPACDACRDGSPHAAVEHVLRHCPPGSQSLVRVVEEATLFHEPDLVGIPF